MMTKEEGERMAESGNNRMDLVEKMNNAPRCGATNRRGEPCKAPAVSGSSRCYYHGGAEGSGASEGNKNAQKHGLYSQEMQEMNDFLKDLLAEMKG
jgi:glucans biosynthesis protein